MSLEQMGIGAAGMGLFSVAAYYNIVLLQAVQEERENALQRWYNDVRGPISFKILAASFILFTLGSITRTAGFGVGNAAIRLVADSVILLAVSGLLFFSRLIAVVTES